MIQRFILIIIILFFQFLLSHAQSPTQTVRGTISDKVSKEKLFGVAVLLVDSSMSKGNATDADGNFRISNVALGRQVLKVSLIGYRMASVPILVTSGKEVVVNVELDQLVIQGKEVTIVAERQKDKANNEMATVSARSFTFDETSRYAGSLNDPARMASNYAGVSGTNDARNDIIIRGNSPLGVLWRMNGMDIPNPNHFGSLGVTGGPISILNNNSLDKSDFLTGAFPAEYGNAIAGAFDLQMRNGNNEKHEFLGQLGFNGIELGAEGPFKKGSSSYIVNYRYSTLGIFQALGIDFGVGNSVPQYQDVSLKVDLPTQKAGKFSVYVIGGISYSEVLDKDQDTTKDNLYNANEMRQDGYFGNDMGVVGLTHLYFFSNKTYSKLNLSASTAGQKYKVDSIAIADSHKSFPWYRNYSDQQKYTLNYSWNKKFSSRNFLKLGVIAERIDFAYRDSILDDNHLFRTITNSEGESYLVQAFTQWQHKFSDKLSINTGVHFQEFLYNNTYSIEPRFGIKWETKEGQSLSFGTGIHSQLQPMYSYFQKTLLQDGTIIETNNDLEMTKSNHFVIAFDKSLGNNMRLKLETYYQRIYNVPAEKRSSTFSMLNEGADFGVSGVDSLTNKGTGKNYGIEFTLEKFYSKGYYFLATGSLFESMYKGSDGIERNTAFNGNYTANVLAGKEFNIRKKNVFSFNFRLVLSGGKRYTPIDFEESQLNNETVYDYKHAFEKKRKDYFRPDIKISYRKNGKRVTQEIGLDIDNVLNIRNIWQEIYDPNSNTIKTEYQIGFFPVPMYRITF